MESKTQTPPRKCIKSTERKQLISRNQEAAIIGNITPGPGVLQQLLSLAPAPTRSLFSWRLSPAETLERLWGLSGKVTSSLMGLSRRP